MWGSSNEYYLSDDVFLRGELGLRIKEREPTGSLALL